MRTAFFTITLALFVVMSGAVPVHGCSCVSGSLSSYYRRADAVVTGTVISVSGEEMTVTAIFEVGDRWKLVTPSQIEVVTEKSSCAYDFQSAQKHLLYLKELPSGKFSTMNCQGNLVLDRSKKARNWLNKYGKKVKVPYSTNLLPNVFVDNLAETFAFHGESVFLVAL